MQYIDIMHLQIHKKDQLPFYLRDLDNPIMLLKIEQNLPDILIYKTQAKLI